MLISFQKADERRSLLGYGILHAVLGSTAVDTTEWRQFVLAPPKHCDIIY